MRTYSIAKYFEELGYEVTPEPPAAGPDGWVDVYLAADVDARISDLERQLAFADDAAAKGESARLTAAGMEARIDELGRALRSCLLVMQHSLEQTTVMERLAKEAVNEAANALMESGS